MPIPGFVATILYLMGGLIIWTTRFLLAYGFTGLYCARPQWQTEFAGFSLAAIVVTMLSLLAIGANAAIFTHAVSRLRSGPAAGSENGRFVHYIAAAVVALGTVAIVWESLPFLMIPVCR